MAVHIPSVVYQGSSISVKFGKLVLTTSQREEIDHGERLKDYILIIITFVQETRNQFHINGILLQNSRKITCNELQVIHSIGNHWIVASTTLSDAECVDVYDCMTVWMMVESITLHISRDLIFALMDNSRN